MLGRVGVGYYVQAVGTDPRRRRHGSCGEWVHEMRSNLGRLAAVAEVLQVGWLLALAGHAWRRGCGGGIGGKINGASHESSLHSGSRRATGGTRLRANARDESDAGWARQV